MKKVQANAAGALQGLLRDNMTIAAGGFGLCGIPENLIQAIVDSGVKGLTIVGNNAGVDDFGMGLLLKSRQVKKVIASYVGENKEFARQFLSGELEVELTPQGTLAEKLRAGGCGIAAFFTLAGVGTQVADGGLPQKYNTDGSVAKASAAKETRELNGSTYVLEESITTDFGLVHALKGDTHGNLIFDRSARNFNPLAAMAGRITIAQVEELVQPGELDPDSIHLPGVFVQRVVAVGKDIEKRIEKRTVQAKASV